MTHTTTPALPDTGIAGTEITGTEITGTEIGAEPSSSRRRMLRLAGAAAAGAAAAAVVGAGAASADNGVSLALGTPNSTNDETRVNYTGGAAGQSGFVFQSGTTYGTNGSNFPAALAGFSGSGNTPPSGVYGYSGNVAGYGVVGDNPSTNGHGVHGRGANGVGVSGEGETGVLGTGTNVGVSATGTGPTSIGVFALGTTGVGAFATGDYAVAAYVSGKANLYLQPNNNFIGPSPKTRPLLRSDAHKAGELECVDGELWFCIADGTPGTWRRLTGPGAGTGYNAGFNAVPPARVYDSRGMTPGGPIVAGQSRDLVLRDKVSATTYAVETAGYVVPGATALVCNITVVNTTSAGFLAVNPLGDTTVHAATVNWSASGQILNNGVTVTLGGDRQVTVIAGGNSGAQTDFVIDVTGYYL